MIKVPAAFKELFDPYDFKIYYGGRNGGKSKTFAQALLILGSQNPLKILCVREYMATIKDSVKSDLDEMIQLMNLEDFYESIKTEIIGLNGTQFIFKGIKLDPIGIKSTSGVNICWVEEAHSVSQTSWDILIPTIREEGSEIWVSFNPDLDTDPVYKMFIIDGRPNTLLKKVTWRDNPFFSERARRDMEFDKKNDPQKYLHIWEGECKTISDAVVFKDKFEVQKFDTPDDEDLIFYHGLDFGFSIDPLAYLRCFIDHNNRKLYIDRAISGVGIEIEDHEDFILSCVPDAKEWVIKADSARPELIDYLNRKGFKIFSAKKGKDSIKEGIEFIKNYRIIIHESLQDVIKEFSTYSYKVDKHTGQILPILEDKNNHFIDALRYALEDIRRCDYKLIVP